MITREYQYCLSTNQGSIFLYSNYIVIKNVSIIIYRLTIFNLYNWRNYEINTHIPNLWKFHHLLQSPQTFNFLDFKICSI